MTVYEDPEADLMIQGVDAYIYRLCAVEHVVSVNENNTKFTCTLVPPLEGDDIYVHDPILLKAE